MKSLSILIRALCFLALFSSNAWGQKADIVDPIKEEKRDQFNLTGYLPTYFLYHEDISKLQASFKYKILRNFPLYLGYTHLIFWQLNEESRPIYDTNYNPELFYRMDVKWDFINSVDFIFMGHKSNGKDRELSRSFDYSGIQFNTEYKFKSYLLRSGLRFKSNYSYDDTNSDLDDYQGPYELNFIAAQFMSGTIDKAELEVRFFPGGKYGQFISKGAHEVTLSFRILGLEITPSFLIQYYKGYNEYLQNYSQKQEIIRFGFLL